MPEDHLGEMKIAFRNAAVSLNNALSGQDQLYAERFPNIKESLESRKTEIHSVFGSGLDAVLKNFTGDIETALFNWLVQADKKIAALEQTEAGARQRYERIRVAVGKLTPEELELLRVPRHIIDEGIKGR